MKYSPLFNSASVEIGSNGFRVLEQPKYASKITVTRVGVRKSGWVSVQYLDQKGDIVAENLFGLREWYPMIGKVMEINESDEENNMFDSLGEILKESTSKDKLLNVVTDELGNTVHIILQTIWDKDGTMMDRGVMAVYPDGTVYPEQADKVVRAAYRSAKKALKEKEGTV